MKDDPLGPLDAALLSASGRQPSHGVTGGELSLDVADLLAEPLSMPIGLSLRTSSSFASLIEAQLSDVGGMSARGVDQPGSARKSSRRR